MIASIWLVRHASTEWTGIRWCGLADPPLSDEGRAEANALAGRLAAALPARPVIVSSPALRARQTAAAVAAWWPGVQPLTDDDLREVDVGGAEGLTFEEVERAFPDIAAGIAAGRLGVDWPAGETASDARARAARAWGRLARRASTGQPVVAVTHGGPIGWMVSVATHVRERPVPGPADVVRLTSVGAGWHTGLEPEGAANEAGR